MLRSWLLREFKERQNCIVYVFKIFQVWVKAIHCCYWVIQSGIGCRYWRWWWLSIELPVNGIHFLFGCCNRIGLLQSHCTTIDGNGCHNCRQRDAGTHSISRAIKRTFRAFVGRAIYLSMPLWFRVPSRDKITHSAQSPTHTRNTIEKHATATPSTNPQWHRQSEGNNHREREQTTYRKYNSADATGCRWGKLSMSMGLARDWEVLPRLDATQKDSHSGRHSDQGNGDRNDSYR